MTSEVSQDAVTIFASLINGLSHPTTVMSERAGHSKVDYDKLVARLTQSEKQVLVGLSLGLSAKEIAKTRGTSNRTVEGHVSSIRIKTNEQRLSPLLMSELFSRCLDQGFRNVVENNNKCTE
jgi:DNA-binding NarL/FixJ family response regulator